MFRSSSIFRRKLNVITVANRTFYTINSSLNDLFTRHTELEFAMDSTRGKKYMNARLLSSFKGFPCAIDVCFMTTRESAERGATHGI